MLLVYDIDFKFGQNFVICLTKSAMESILAVPIEEETTDKGESVFVSGYIHGRFMMVIQL